MKNARQVVALISRIPANALLCTVLSAMAITGYSGNARADAAAVQCDADNGGIILPGGFCAVVVADNLGETRHIAVNANGDVYARLREKQPGGSIVALRDTDGDGRADRTEYFGREDGGTGLEIHNGYLYYSTTVTVHRVRLTDGDLVPQAEPQTIVAELPQQHSHAAKSLALDDAGHLYVNIGAPSNSCQKQDRVIRSPGMDPCPLLEQHAGVWRFDANKTGQTQARDGYRFSTGSRNLVALDWNPLTGNLYAAQHGRDQLAQNWGYPELEGAVLPAEEVFRIQDGDNFGWPYAYYDYVRQQKLLMPEYGGDGKIVGRAAGFKMPIAAFPGHWGPNDLVFYTGTQFPLQYRGGMFIVFHGSWNRAPLPQDGYKVMFVPFDGDEPLPLKQTFANGFKGRERLENRAGTRFRPTGLAVGPDGSLYISEDKTGRIWRVVYKGGG